jgi:putative glycosyltransferase (TIGR04348 family)
MKISLITPAAEGSRAGNRTTAMRWAQILRSLGHRIDLGTTYDGASADLLVALHAWRSSESIHAFRDRYPKRPLVVALTGTDIYRFQQTDPQATQASMTAADRLVGLHDLVGNAIPEWARGKLRIIYQSATAPPHRLVPLRRSFEVLVLGHLREEKDPLRTALAARSVPAESRLRVVHLGKAQDEHWADMAREEMAGNPRYRWLGEVPGRSVRRALARAPLMVLSSTMEGGANVISEAVAAGTPIIASRIDGSVGLLGGDYPGYFPVGDTAALTGLLWRAESEPAFIDELRRHCAARAPLFAPTREQRAWRDLLLELTGTG